MKSIGAQSLSFNQQKYIQYIWKSIDTCCRIRLCAVLLQQQQNTHAFVCASIALQFIWSMCILVCLLYLVYVYGSAKRNIRRVWRTVRWACGQRDKKARSLSVSPSHPHSASPKMNHCFFFGSHANQIIYM